jgi:preprotein translocase subunit SecA
MEIIIVDLENTGRLNIGSRWSNGLHEFVEVKHKIKPKDESLTAASMSHPAFFNEYKLIYGLTGTIGT